MEFENSLEVKCTNSEAPRYSIANLRLDINFLLRTLQP
jgi:hypothetical protein